MRRLVPALAVLLSTAHAADVPRGAPLDPARAADWSVDVDALWGPDHPLAGQRLVIDRRGHVTGVNRLGALTPRPLAELGAYTVIAPFWAPLDAGQCPDRAQPPIDGVHPLLGHVERAVDPVSGAVTIGWIGIPRPDCAAEARSTFAMALRPTDAGGLEVTFTYEALPPDGEVAPRAGVVVGEQVFELLPDRAGHTPPDRGKALLSGSSDGEAGVWTFELDAAGALEITDDPDRDGVRSVDNCERAFNPLQENNDAANEPEGERLGDVCDEDDDDDLVYDVFDNCQRVSNPDQLDSDRDGVGDVCDDDDRDGLLDVHDLCPRVADAARLDLDGDGRGDACDPDIDGDDITRLRIGGGKRARVDRCPYVYEVGAPDADGDGLGDACDARPVHHCSGLYCMLELDSDGDGLLDIMDLCPTQPDHGFDRDNGEAPPDADGDGLGDGCDPDANGDGVLDFYQQFDHRGADHMLSPILGIYP